MVKKKFIDKKKSATFQLIARDTSDPNYSLDPSGDRVFVRVDNNQFALRSLLDDDSAVFDDISEDCSEKVAYNGIGGSLPDHVRREILELGFPDDGYNYLTHLREIKNAGAGSAFYQNPRANIDQLPRDVKAYDASKVEIDKLSDPSEEKSLYMASKTVSVRLQKVMDPEVAALLDDSDSLKSNSEDLEEDFVIKANNMDMPITEETTEMDAEFSGAKDNVADSDIVEHRVRRPLDEQFDMLELQEYDNDDVEDCNEYVDEFEIQESLAKKLNDAFKDHPSDLLRLKKETDDNEPPELSAAVIQRCRKYAENYENESHGDDTVLVEESSDESEVWDCETIVSTYSTLDNHPGKIGAPESRRKKKTAVTIPETSVLTIPKILLKGKESFPVDFLPRRGKHGEEKSMKDEIDSKPEIQNKKLRGQESKEEKKERKSAIKLERREARRVKKETKELYKSESHHAQKVAAFTGPSSIHLK